MLTPEMRVSRLLDEFPQALDVLLRASPHFEKLKNPLLRRFVAPRASIADAARIGGVPLDRLLRELNVACGFGAIADDAAKSESDVTTAKPSIIADAPVDAFIMLDVREDIRADKDPFKNIMAAVKRMRAGEILHLVNSFEPVPLYEVLARRGLAHWTEREGEIVHVYFYAAPASETRADTRERGDAGEERIITLDVAGLEPPEPMMKILATLPEVDAHTVLVVHHHREPLMLYDKLKERGYAWETTMLGENAFRITIRLRNDQ